MKRIMIRFYFTQDYQTGHWYFAFSICERFITVKRSAKPLPEIFNDHDPLEAKLVWERLGLQVWRNQ